MYVYMRDPFAHPSHSPDPFLLARPPSCVPYSSNTSSTRGERFRCVGAAVDICGADDEVVVAVAGGGWPGTWSGLPAEPEEEALLDFFLDFFFS